VRARRWPIEASAAGSTAERREAEDGERQAEDGEHGIFTSRASIFLPRYSGVRPTIRPATKTAMHAKSSMP
jgi:hypothetical protein